MKRLVYCIFRQGADTPAPEPGTCYIVAGSGLAAVVSTAETLTPPGVSSLLEFERVVGAMHSGLDVIPLRYGHVTESEEATVRLLDEHREEYELLLTRLRDMAEMGIRVLCPEEPASAAPTSLSPGASYLASLRSRRRLRSILAPDEVRLAGRITGPLAGCYTRQRAESSPAAGQGRLLSLYLLLPKTGVEAFRDKARAISLPEVKIMLSGPWPPWNFVALND